MILLDTCLLSELVRPGADPRVLAWFDRQDEQSLWISVLTIGEIRKGAELLEPGHRQRRILGWLEELKQHFGDRLLPVDDAVALAWGSLSAAAQRSGRKRPPIDSLLGATARHHGLILATRNVADFEGMGVQLVNPWEDSARSPQALSISTPMSED